MVFSTHCIWRLNTVFAGIMSPLLPWSKKPRRTHSKQTIKQKLDKLDFAERKAKAEVKVTGFLQAMKDPALQQQ